MQHLMLWLGTFTHSSCNATSNVMLGTFTILPLMQNLMLGTFTILPAMQHIFI